MLIGKKTEIIPVRPMDPKDIASPSQYAKQYSHHRWYPMTPMLPVTLVKAYLKAISPKCVLDPFVGVGTTLVEARYKGIQSIGIDANPFMCLVSSVKTRNYDVTELETEWSRVISNTKFSKLPFIPNIDRYYDKATLTELLKIKGGIKRVRSRMLKKLFLVALAYVSTKVANVKMTPAPEFIKRRHNMDDVKIAFTEYLERVRNDCENYRYRNSTRIVNGDARSLDCLDEKVDCIITSPPYCNNLDYVRHTQLELYWTDLVKSWEGLAPIRKECITSCEAMAYHGKDVGVVDPRILKIAAHIRERTNRALPSTVIQYFSGMRLHLASAYSVLKPSGMAVYVLGDSWFKDVHIPTHSIFGNMAKKVGFKSVKIRYLRARRDPYHHNLGEYVITLSL